MSCRVYVGHLPYSARERDVEKFFRGFGRLREINLKNGFCFVEFEDPRDADDAVYEMNGREMLGERVVVEHSRGPGPRGRGSYGGGGGGYGGGGGGYRGFNRGNRSYGPPVRTDYRVTVENLSSRVSWQDLKDFLRPVAEVTYADAHKQRIGEGVVEFKTRDDMERAIRKLDGTELNGRKISLIEDSSGHRGSRSSRRSRSRSRSRSPRRRSRSRSHSRSRSRRSRSRSRSSGKRSRSRSRSKSASRDRSKSRERSRDRSRSRSGSRDRSRERSRERSRSRSGSPVNGERGQSGEPSSPADRSGDHEQSPGNDQPEESEQVQDEEESKHEEEPDPAVEAEQEDVDNES